LRAGDFARVDLVLSRLGRLRTRSPNCRSNRIEVADTHDVSGCLSSSTARERSGSCGRNKMKRNRASCRPS
jgi:hypothetical protein